MNIRIVRRRNFLTMDNYALEDPNLTFKAKGVLAYLLSKPDAWKARARDLEARSADGRHAILSALRELRRLGYAEIRPVQEPKTGRMMGKELIVYELPKSRFPHPRVPPSSENRAYSNTKEESNTDSAPRSGPPGQHPSFDLEEPDINGSRIIKYSTPVVMFAKYTIRSKLHILGVYPNTQRIKYVKGATAGSWSPQTLAGWEACYLGLKERIGDPQKIERVVAWFIKNAHHEYTPTARTFPSFCEKFDQIEKALRRHTQSRNGEYRNGYQDEDEPRSKIRVIVDGVLQEPDED